VATEEEIRLGRVAVAYGFATEEQVMDALRVRNSSGGELGALLVKRGLIPAAELARLKEEARRPTGPKNREELSTEHEISIGGTREILARDQLNEALRDVKRDPKAAVRALRRLAEEFPDTESGVRAENEVKGMLATHPELDS
jgi:hypothetical protein